MTIGHLGIFTGVDWLRKSRSMSLVMSFYKNGALWSEMTVRTVVVRHKWSTYEGSTGNNESKSKQNGWHGLRSISMMSVTAKVNEKGKELVFVCPEHVVRFDISMDDAMSIQIFNATEHSLKAVERHFFLPHLEVKANWH